MFLGRQLMSAYMHPQGRCTRSYKLIKFWHVLIYGSHTVYPSPICVLAADTLTIEVLSDRQVQRTPFTYKNRSMTTQGSWTWISVRGRYLWHTLFVREIAR